MILNELLIACGGVLTTAFTGWFTWKRTKKKYYSEVDHNLIENMENSLEFYKTLSDDNKVRLDILTEENDRLRDEVQEIRKQMLELTLNICLDLTCANRIIDPKRLQKDAESEDRLSETESHSRRGTKPVGE